MESNAIKLNEIVAPAFYNVFWDILDGKHTYYDLYGGRGSTKSSFVGGMIPFQMMQDAENGLMSNAVIFRKVGIRSENLCMNRSHGELMRLEQVIYGLTV